MPLKRPTIPSGPLSLAVALYLMFATNQTFWQRTWDYFGAHPSGFWAFSIGITAGITALVLSLSVKYAIKPLFILFIMSAAAASWFTDRFGVIVDTDMIRNAVQTTPAEAGHLMTPAFLMHMTVFGIIPSLLIAWVRIGHRPILQKVKWNLVLIVPLLFVFAGSAFAEMATIASTLRQHRDLIKTLNPVTPIISAVKFVIRSAADQTIVLQPVDTDAKKGPALASAKKPVVTIIVAGETARAQNFSLGGYGKKTNPLLEKQDIIYFSQATSCGTATATSIPCMFSRYARSEYSHSLGIGTENVLDVLSHAGIHAEWWENNTGDKEVAKRITQVNYSLANDPKYCVDHECRDDVLTDNLDAWLDKVTADSVLVLHQLGSHGPTYYLRYTDEFRRFVPDCQTAEFAKCTQDEIVNSYDNTIIYTDYILSTVIDKLKARGDKMETAMIYMSDHGESLGENGLYLHGAPYIFAPEEQTRVPFILWMSEAFSETMKIDRSCLAAKAAAPVSQDNLYHTVLGLMDIEANSRQDGLDLTASCKTVLTQ